MKRRLRRLEKKAAVCYSFVEVLQTTAGPPHAEDSKHASKVRRAISSNINTSNILHNHYQLINQHTLLLAMQVFQILSFFCSFVLSAPLSPSQDDQ